ncbi:hypothetical protein ACU3L3_08730 [Priestia endophytica]|jgi:hypothetical protein|uniref:Uncharacterized protein n=1 Tax=Priestia endophytica DSM 13796 TaxID=1121089 RepID=A0A1I6AGE9_9BACI|nr:hypothetical protein [Priestia endophytica]KAB2494372.1 hypothetical protein F8155_07280 [Priestia endophytica]KYG27463.1 hypothetical protein AZF06_14710 [Priestia endophytica]MBG9814393.1 hypothetical protein [Priestia endophytica]RAS80089.1 hypothetical protein A4U60_15555 [Priestia endophytica]RAS86900.1 hypothetical protein A4R27_00790 [Priestia endophytica]
MMLFDIKHKLYYEAINTSRPLMSLSHQGRTWGYVPKLLNGKKVKFWVDYTHGRYMYFEHDQKWYRVRYLQSNYKKQNHDIFNGVLIDLLTEGEELKLLKGKIEKDKRLLI